MGAPALLSGAATTAVTSSVGIAQAAASGDPPYITLAVALLAGGVVTAMVNGWLRKRSGEGPASAADSLSQAAERLAGTAEDLVIPLQRANASLAAQVAELQGKLAARAEELLRISDMLSDAHGKLAHEQSSHRAAMHSVASEMATMAANLATANLIIAERDEEISSLRIEVGRDPGRRDLDPPDPPAPT